MSLLRGQFHRFISLNFQIDVRIISQKSCNRCERAWANASNHDCQRLYSQQPNPRKGFFAEFLDNLKQEAAKNKEMKDSLKKFRDEYDRLEQSEALKKAREKFQSIEAEAQKDALKKGLSSVQEKLKSTAEEFEKSDVGKKGKQIAEDLSKYAGKTADSIYQQSKTLSETQVYKSISQGVKAVRDEVEEATDANTRIYRPPSQLLKRSDLALFKTEEKIVEANTEATGVELHKNSRFYQSWQSFKDNNVFVHKLFDIKMRYDESDNVVIRATRAVTDKFTELFGNVFSKTEMSEVLTEVIKMDPTFNKEKFIRNCRLLYIPNILEAMLRADLPVLEDWCYEAAYNVISQPLKHAKEAGYIMNSRVLDINHVDIVAGKMMEQGPVLVITFVAQQVMCARNAGNEVVEGDPDKIMRVYHVWAFCRDATILDPLSAWRLIDLSSSPAEQFL